jgi:galactonate dehydratase
MRITDVKVYLCQGGIKTWTLVKVSTDAGIVGWGDASEWASVQVHAKAIEEFAGLVIGEDPLAIERLWQKVWVAAYAGGKDCNVALTGIETALWDIAGKAYGAPVYALLGGKCHDRVRLYADLADAYGSGFGGGHRWREGDTSLAGVARQAAYIKSMGYTALKCHPLDLATRPAVTRTVSLNAIDATVEKLATIRDAVGSDVDIAMDINNRLDLPSSIALAKAVEPYRLMFLEDTIRQDESPASYRRLVESTSTPIGTGENLYTVWSFRNYLEIGALDVVLPDACHTGVLQFRKIAALAEAFHLPVAPHNPNSPLSTIISGHLCASIPNHLALEYDLDELEPPWRDSITSPSVGELVQDGHLEVPTGPGWGVEINEEELARHPYEEVWLSGLGRSREGLEIR